jgi:hypothetical protein
MKNLTILFGIIPICLALSCKPARVVTNIKEIVTHDTIRDVRIVERYKAVIDTLVIDNPCDSSGILSNFYSKLVIPQGKVIIRSLNGKIQATVNIDSIQSVYESKYKSLVNKNVETEKIFIRTNVVPSWAIITIFIESLIILLYFYFKFINPFK